MQRLRKQITNLPYKLPGLCRAMQKERGNQRGKASRTGGSLPGHYAEYQKGR